MTVGCVGKRVVLPEAGASLLRLLCTSVCWHVKLDDLLCYSFITIVSLIVLVFSVGLLALTAESPERIHSSRLVIHEGRQEKLVLLELIRTSRATSDAGPVLIFQVTWTHIVRLDRRRYGAGTSLEFFEDMLGVSW